MIQQKMFSLFNFNSSIVQQQIQTFLPLKSLTTTTNFFKSLSHVVPSNKRPNINPSEM